MVDSTLNNNLPPCNIYICSKGKDSVQYFAGETHKAVITNINAVINVFFFQA